MKQCRYCEKYYKESDFGIAKTTKNKVYRRHKCRYCYRKTKTKLKSKYKKWVNEYKAKHGCKKCGINDYRVLDFHHTEGKEFGIAEAFYYQYGLDRMQKEIKKCIVVCANCHRVEHYK